MQLTACWFTTPSLPPPPPPPPFDPDAREVKGRILFDGQSFPDAPPRESPLKTTLSSLERVPPRDTAAAAAAFVIAVVAVVVVPDAIAPLCIVNIEALLRQVFLALCLAARDSARLPYPAVMVEPPRSVSTAVIAQSNSKYWSVVSPV